MKTGKWNYTEDIQYKVVLVKLLPVPETPLHWQNAFAGQERQAVQVEYPGQSPFLMDNADGTGLLKIARGGGPDSYSAHIDHFEMIRDLPETEWQQYNRGLFEQYRKEADDYGREHHPEQYKKLQALKDAYKNKFAR